MLAIIVAMDQNNGIGWCNGLPWHFPEDLRYFKTQTEGHTIVMGYKTFCSLHRPLPNRHNIVITRQNIALSGVEIVHDFDAFLKKEYKTPTRIFIIGGQSIYTQALPYAQELYVTYIPGTHQTDVHFPVFDTKDFRVRFEAYQHPLHFVQYVRIESCH